MNRGPKYLGSYFCIEAIVEKQDIIIDTGSCTVPHIGHWLSFVSHSFWALCCCILSGKQNNCTPIWKAWVLLALDVVVHQGLTGEYLLFCLPVTTLKLVDCIINLSKHLNGKVFAWNWIYRWLTSFIILVGPTPVICKCGNWDHDPIKSIWNTLKKPVLLAIYIPIF